MSNGLSKPLVFAVAVLFAAMVPWALAQGPGTSPTGQQRAMPTPGMQSPHMGAMDAQDTISATVTEVNHQRQTVKLRLQHGDTIELKVPEGLVSDLHRGDSVQVSIHKAEGHPGTGDMQPSRPQSSTETRPQSGQ